MPALTISTYSFGPEADVRRVLDIGLASNFTGFELGSFTYWPEALSSGDVSHVRDTVARNNWSLSIHFIHRGVSLGHHDPEARTRLVHQLQETVRLAEKLGGRSIVVHIGGVTRPSPPDLEAARREAYELALDSLKQCAPVAERYGVYLCVENTHLREPDILRSLEEYNQMVEAVDSPYVKFTLDFGHANVSTGISQAIQELRPRLHHIHIHDNHGQQDEHLEIGKGTIDFQAYADFLRTFPQMIAFETRDPQDEEETVVRSRRKLGGILGL